MLNLAKIDLNALTTNALLIKTRLPNKVKFCAVVKADAYGHGAIPVANAVYNIVDCFAVAIVEEGLSLRLGGVGKDILVLNPPLNAQDISDGVRQGLTFTVQSLDTIDKIERECERQCRKAKLHIKFNTGMNRLGVDDLTQLDMLAKRISKSKRLILDGAYSHLPEPENKKRLKYAVNKFLLANNLVKGYNNNATCHLSASGGFIKGVFFDMVRVGVLLYGYKPFKDAIPVQPIMKVYSPVVTRREMKKGEHLLYGGQRLAKDTEVAIVRYGYADGLSREKTGELLANRCMDLSAYPLKDGDRYCVMDDALRLAKENHTIPYEILTKATLRAERIYIT